LTGSALLIFLNCTGCCTLGGYLIGSHLDKNHAVIKSPLLDGVQKIQPNTPVTIYIRNKMIPAGVRSGLFQGLEKVADQEYLRRYNSFNLELTDQKLFPAMGDTITVYAKAPAIDQAGKTAAGLFTGFDLNSLQFKLPADSSVDDLKLEELHYMTGRQDSKIDLAEIKRYLDAGLVPLRSELVIAEGAELQRIPLEKVIQVEVPRHSRGRIIFSAIGLAVDTYLLLAALREMGREWSGFTLGLTL